ncbi:MAG: hypothetical protein HFH62_04465 [Lachnospiraceae bacterium]|nr:hypothetical protein [Lachnospiraceae bacterium]
MKTYHMIDKRDRNARSELKHYTFEQVKAYFEPNFEEFPELHEKWVEIKDISDLEDYLNDEADGMEVPFIFEEDCVEDEDAMIRANSFFKCAR